MKLPNNSLLILDGYNLIFSVGLQSVKQNPRQLENARKRLLALLVEFIPAETLRKTIVVFDSASRPIHATQDIYFQDGVFVAYAVGYENADEMIKELLERHSSPKRLTVVSSDHQVQTAARARKSKTIDSDVWLDKLEAGEYKSSQSPSIPSEKSIPQGLTDIDWASEFGLDSEDSG